MLTAIEKVELDLVTPIEQKQAYPKSIIQQLPVLNNDPTGLRVDLSIEDPTTGEHKLIDVTVSHTTSASYLSSEFKAVTQRQLSTTFANSLKLPDTLLTEPSPTLAHKEKLKIEKYSRLLVVTKRQYTQRKRKQAPSFSPFALADNGELGPSAISFQEWLVERYRKHIVAEPPHIDELDSQALIRSFRHRLKLSVQIALASGYGAMLNSAGGPWDSY